MRVHANDGIAKNAQDQLAAEGFTLTTNTVAQDALADFLRREHVDVLLVRSATQVRRDLIDACPDLKVIGRGGVGMDNIDVDHARGKGIKVVNTPASSGISVAELVMAHLFSLSRELYKANRRMPAEGATAFKELKKAYGKGRELRGKTLGIIGFGRIGRWVARYAVGAGMKVIYTDHHITVDHLDMEFNGETFRVGIKMVPLEELLEKSDAITLHVPSKADNSPVLGAAEFARMKPGMLLVNTARGNSIDEAELLKALQAGTVRAAGLDVFQGEPVPNAQLLAQPNLSLSPHIGAATTEAQDRIGTELAELLIAWRDEVTVGRG